MELKILQLIHLTVSLVLEPVQSVMGLLQHALGARLLTFCLEILVRQPVELQSLGMLPIECVKIEDQTEMYAQMKRLVPLVLLDFSCLKVHELLLVHQTQ